MTPEYDISRRSDFKWNVWRRWGARNPWLIVRVFTAKYRAKSYVKGALARHRAMELRRTENGFVKGWTREGARPITGSSNA